MKAKWGCMGLALGLWSCSTSWTAERIAHTKNTCIRLTAPLEGDSLAQIICTCYVEQLVQRFPANDQSPEDIQPIINDCVAEHPHSEP